MSGPMLVRVQDASGRGPWRPGLSGQWVSDARVSFLPPIYEELGAKRFTRIVSEAHAAGLHVGCAISPRRLREWFDEGERRRLLAMGFNLVSADGCKVLASTMTQRLVGSPAPLSELPIIEWPEHRRAA